MKSYVKRYVFFAMRALYGLCAAAAWEQTVSDTADFVKVIAAINADAGGGGFTIALNGSFTASSVTFTGGAAKTITLKGDGAARVITNSEDTALFAVPAGVTLVLDSNLVLDGGNKKGRLVYVDGGTLVMKAGSTLRNSANGGARIDSGSFTMSGGTISGNSASSYGGGGVVVGSGGSFTMNGGTISGNTTIGDYNNGGGVNMSGGSFTMSGGTICGNTANGYGGGVVVGSGGSFTMSGGTISGNSASSYGGGGVCLVFGSFTMSGGTISGNTSSDGGGVFVGGIFTMSGGTISGNTANDGSGGGVYFSGGSFVKRGGGTIDAANTAKDGTGVVFVYVPSGSQRRNSAVGPEVNLDSNIEGRAGGWEERAALP